MNPNQGYKFIYSKDGVTVAYKINDADQTVSYAFALQHPGDIENRKIGRQVARGRLDKGGINKNGSPRNYTVSLADATNGSTKYNDIAGYLFKTISRLLMEKAADRGDGMAQFALMLLDAAAVGIPAIPADEHSVTGIGLDPAYVPTLH